MTMHYCSMYYLNTFISVVLVAGVLQPEREFFQLLCPQSRHSRVAADSCSSCLGYFPIHSKCPVSSAPEGLNKNELFGHSIPVQENIHQEKRLDASSSPPNPTRNLPPLEDATSDGIDQQLPTFNEYHAMLSTGTDRKPVNDGLCDTVFDADLSAPNSIHSRDVAHDSSKDPTHDTATSSNSSAIERGMNMTSDQSEHTNGRQSTKTNSVKPAENGVTSSSSDHPNNDPQSTSFHSVAINSRLSSSDNEHKKLVPSQSHTSITVRRNVAAVGCFAKLLEASNALKNPESILNDNNDEYMNVPCAAEKWFVIETCEPVQLREIELASYELFSSRVKTFRILISDRYPAKSWDLAGTFVARDLKGLQAFQMKSDKLIKYVKFELLDHYGSEHYCPLTMVRLFGRVADDMDEEEDDLTLQATSLGTPDMLPRVEAAVEAKKVQNTNTSVASAISNHPEAPDQPPISNPQSTPSTTSDNHISDGRSVPDEPRLEIRPTSPVENSETDELYTPASKTRHSETGAPGSEILPSVDANRSTIVDVAINERSTELTSKDTKVQTPPDPTPLPSGKWSNPRPPQPDVAAALLPSSQPDRPVSEFGSHHNLASIDTDDSFGLSLVAQVKTFVFSLFSSSLSLVASSRYHRFDSTPSKNEYNLSAVSICPAHVAAIDSLLLYNLLNASIPLSHMSEDKSTALPQSLRYLGSLLARCFTQLSQLVHESDSFIGVGSPLAIRHRILLLPSDLQHPTVSDCNESGRLLNLSFFSGYHPCVQNESDLFATSEWTILQLFVAFQYRMQLKSLSGNSRCTSSWSFTPVSPANSLSLRPKCPRLPDFMVRASEFKPPIVENVEPRLFKDHNSYPFSARNSASPTTLDPKPKNRIVVPASLAGSRQDTALMRLSNRVRLLERNVSVSMRYLEELSQSYRRQMERLSRSFNLTTAWLRATAQGAEERDQLQQARINELEKRLDELLVRIRSGSGNHLSEAPELPLVNLSSQSNSTGTSIEISTPPLPSFEPPADWGASPNYDVWSQMAADDWPEADGVVETEDECFGDFSRRGDTPALDAGPNSQRIYLPFGNRFPLREPNGWKDWFYTWLYPTFVSQAFIHSLQWLLNWSPVHTYIAWACVTVLVHLGFAFIAHLIVYLVWLRPKLILHDKRSQVHYSNGTVAHVMDYPICTTNHPTLRYNCTNLDQSYSQPTKKLSQACSLLTNSSASLIRPHGRQNPNEPAVEIIQTPVTNGLVLITSSRGVHYGLSQQHQHGDPCPSRLGQSEFTQLRPDNISVSNLGSALPGSSIHENALLNGPPTIATSSAVGVANSNRSFNNLHIIDTTGVPLPRDNTGSVLSKSARRRRNRKIRDPNRP